MYYAHMNGYPPQLPRQQVLECQVTAYQGMISDHPGNRYFRNRLEEVTAELDAIYSEQNPAECDCSPIQEVACPYCLELDAEEVF